LVLAAYQRPREKKPSSARTRMTIRMIQRRSTRLLSVVVYSYNGEGS
jgi:hypothetical protein